MAVPFDTPVSAIEGIGPSIENLLQPNGIYSVYDLLRVTSPACELLWMTRPSPRCGPKARPCR